MQRTRAAALVAAAVLAAVAAGSSSAANPARTTWNPPVLVTSSKAYIEASLAVDPTDDRRSFTCSPSATTAATDGQSWFFSSRDSGKRWSYLTVKTDPADLRRAVVEGEDCDVAYDQAGTMYVADNSIASVSVGHSRDHGKTWSGTPLAATSPIADRPWLLGGRAGEVFMTYQDVQCCMPSAMWFTKSTDYGQTFSPAVPITTAGPDGLFTWEGNLVADPAGRVLDLVFTRRQGLNHEPEGPEGVYVAHSSDGGQTWSPRLITTLPQQTTTIYPSLARDDSGGLHAVWSAPGAGSNPVWYAYAADGQHWSAPVALNGGQVGWAPWVAAGKAGQAVIGWLGSPDHNADALTKHPWYFGWAKVSHPGGRVSVAKGFTTADPVFDGTQGKPEFTTVRLDRAGRAHLAMVTLRADGSWSLYSQVESAS